MSFGNFGSKPIKTPNAPKAPGKKPFSSRTVIGVYVSYSPCLSPLVLLPW